MRTGDGHPNFPCHDLLRHAGDPNPRMRRLALDDPESTAAPVERFSRDGHEEVRHRAAADRSRAAIRGRVAQGRSES